ncbi:MAG: CoA transferase [Candidatus Lambdaproteobacteria bacterium]|nr:CoA transferase [Candidatus Lambdaproteobacteria bacterium]
MKREGLPYSGVTVVDFTRLLPGGWCTQLLADSGADVIKVEHPAGGDYSRHNPPNFRFTGVYFNSVNRNKRSIALDLNHPRGREVAQRLAGAADVVVEAFRPGVAAKWGLDYVALRHAHERLVYCSLTGFGQDGPLAAQAGHDLNIQGVTGLMGVALAPGELALSPGFQAADYAGAAMACIAIMAGLAQRERTGRGCYLDISMFDALFSMCNIVLTSAMSRLGGGTGQPAMQPRGGNPRYAVYAARDGGLVSVSLLEKKFWKLFCEESGRPELYDEAEESHQRHTDHGDRGPAYRQAIAAFCGAHDRAELVRRMHAAGIPVFPVHTPDEALRDPLVAARGMVEYIDHPREGRIPQLGNPLSRGGLADSRRAPAPELGAHTDDVLAELGYSRAERQQLAELGVTGHGAAS